MSHEEAKKSDSLKRIEEKMLREYQTNDMQECIASCKREELCVGQNIKFISGKVINCQLLTLELTFTSQQTVLQQTLVNV